jgi:hypothetical protein
VRPVGSPAGSILEHACRFCALSKHPRPIETECNLWPGHYWMMHGQSLSDTPLPLRCRLPLPFVRNQISGRGLLQGTLISADDVSNVCDPSGRYFGNERCDCSPVCQEPLLPKPRYSPTLTIEDQTRHSSVEAKHTAFVVELMILTTIAAPGPSQTPSTSLDRAARALGLVRTLVVSELSDFTIDIPNANLSA